MRGLRTMRALAASCGAVVLAGALSVAVAERASGQEFWPPQAETVVADGYRQSGLTEERWREGAWVPSRREIRDYDAAGLLVRKMFESFDDGSWRTTRRESFRHDGQGRPVQLIREDLRGRVYHPTEKWRYVHDDNGRLHELHVDAFGPGGREVPVFLHTWSYIRQRTERLQHRWQGDGWSEEARFVQRLDAAGRLTSETQQQRVEGGEWTDRQRLVVAYDAGGRATRRTLQVAAEGEWIDALREVYGYDVAGRRTTVEHQTRTRSGGLETSARELRRYDEAGNQIETVFQLLRDGDFVDARRELNTFERGSTGR